MSTIILVTAEKAVPVSSAFLARVAVAATLGTVLADVPTHVSNGMR